MRSFITMEIAVPLIFSSLLCPSKKIDWIHTFQDKGSHSTHTEAPLEIGNFGYDIALFVIPTKVGIQELWLWIPASAGMTTIGNFLYYKKAVNLNK